VKDGTPLELKQTVLGAKDLRAGKIGGQQIRGELNAVEIALDARCQDLDGTGLCQSRRSLHQQVAIRQQGDQHALHQGLLSQYSLLDPGLQCFDFFERCQWLGQIR